MTWDWRPTGRRLLAESIDLRLALLAGIVGIAAGMGAVVFRLLIGLFHYYRDLISAPVNKRTAYHDNRRNTVGIDQFSNSINHYTRGAGADTGI